MDVQLPVPVDDYAPLYQALIETLRTVTGMTGPDNAMEYSAARVTAGLYVQTCLARGQKALPLKWAITALRQHDCQPLPQENVLETLITQVNALPETARNTEEIAVAQSLIHVLCRTRSCR